MQVRPNELDWSWLDWVGRCWRKNYSCILINVFVQFLKAPKFFNSDFLVELRLGVLFVPFIFVAQKLRCIVSKEI